MKEVRPYVLAGIGCYISRSQAYGFIDRMRYMSTEEVKEHLDDYIYRIGQLHHTSRHEAYWYAEKLAKEYAKRKHYLM